MKHNNDFSREEIFTLVRSIVSYVSCQYRYCCYSSGAMGKM